MIFEIDKKPSEDKAIIFQNQIISFGQLKERILEVNQKIRHEHSLVFCLCKNCPESVIGYLAFLDSENVPLLLDAKINADELEQLIDIYKPEYIWRPVQADSYEYELVDCCMGETYDKSVDSNLNERLALLLTTSGSTGSKKFVRLSRENITSNAQAISEYLNLNKDERPITRLPMYYTYGLSVINSHLLVGACIVLTDRSTLEPDFWRAVDEHQVTSFSGVPYSYELLRQIRFLRGGLGKSIKTFTQAGGHLSEGLQQELIDFCQKNDKRLVVMYGQTEATARMSYLPYEKSSEKLGSIGIPIPGGCFELRREDGSVIEGAGEVGELIYLGPNVSLGYATCREDLLLGDERQGTLFTGDMAQRDEEGYYYIKGRKKRFLKMRGNRVSLDECEALLKKNYSECDFVCSGSDDRLVIYKTNDRIKNARHYLSDVLNLDYHLFEEHFIYSIPRTDSGKVFYKKLDEEIYNKIDVFSKLTEYHRAHCKKYDAMLDAVEFEDIPFLPAGLFKSVELSSLDEGAEFRVATSSGTSNSGQSMVVIDGETAVAQQMALVDIVSEYIGTKRLPMLVIDAKETVSYGASYSARAAGIQGFSIFGRNRTFALDENLELDVDVVKDFLEKYGNESFLVFGFTHLVWLNLVEKVNEAGLNLDMSKAVLIHGGGWKKLQSVQVSNEEYKRSLKDSVGITRCHDYYGMAEQAGSIFMECEQGYLHVSKYSDVIIRNAVDFSACEFGETGIIQVMSTLPKSYPGHSILTEDEGMLIGEDDCKCGRCGKYFIVNGRVKNAKLRGCSDLREAGSKATANTFAGNNSCDAAGNIVVNAPIEYVFGNAEILENIGREKSVEVFSDETVDFLDSWSKEIRKIPGARSDLAAFGFWIRRSNIERIKRANESIKDRTGYGVVLHFAPSNIPTLFAYSMVSSLLTGNCCIIRLPNRSDAGMVLLVDALEKAIENYPEFRSRIVLLRYDHNKNITDALSQKCRVRIIWGGDNSIAEIEKSSLAPVARNIRFGDRDSLAVLDAKSVCEATDLELERLVYDFYNDTYLTDQNACSSPEIMFWVGDAKLCEKAQSRFWNLLHEYLVRNYQVQDVMAIRKLENVLSMASGISGCRSINEYGDNYITRVNIDDVSPEQRRAVWDFTMPGGFFLEKNINALETTEEFITEKCQTLVYYGFSESEKDYLDSLISDNKIKRAVPVGQGLVFDLNWDGMDLIKEQIK